MAVGPESRLKIKVKKDLKTLKKCWVLKTNEKFLHGVPDFLICINGLFFALELKDKDAKPQPHEPLQRHTLKCIIEAGGIGHTVNQDTWPGVFEEIKKL